MEANSLTRKAAHTPHCDGCGKPRKNYSILRDANGDPDVGVCFICHKESLRGRFFNASTGRYERSRKDDST